MIIANNNISPMLTAGEAAKLLNVHINTMRRWSDQGMIRSYRLGKRGDRRFLKEDVNDMLYDFHNNGNVNKVKINSS